MSLGKKNHDEATTGEDRDNRHSALRRLERRQMQIDKLEFTKKCQVSPPVLRPLKDRAASEPLRQIFAGVKWHVAFAGTPIVLGAKGKGTGRFIIKFNGIKCLRAWKGADQRGNNQLDAYEWKELDTSGFDPSAIAIGAAVGGLNAAEAELADLCARHYQTEVISREYAIPVVEFCNELGPGSIHEVRSAYDEASSLLKCNFGSLYTLKEYSRNPCYSAQVGALKGHPAQAFGGHVHYKVYPKGNYLRFEVVYKRPKFPRALVSSTDVEQGLKALAEDARRRFERIFSHVPDPRRFELSEHTWIEILQDRFNVAKRGPSFRISHFVQGLNNEGLYDPATLPKQLRLGQKALRALADPISGILEKHCRGKGCKANGMPFYVLKESFKKENRMKEDDR